MWTDTEQMQPVPTPLALELSELPSVIQDYVHASRSAMEAGFDGVELHGANGYLLEQFLSPASNQRTDDYGGSFENRNRLTIEVASAVAAAIGGDKLGIRLSPYGVYNDITAAPDVDEQYTALAAALKAEGLVYIHIVDHSAGGAPEVPQSLKDAIRAAFGDTIILSGGYDADRAESDLIAGLGNLVAFGTKFISNPDLVSRFASGEELAPFDHTTFYTADEKGYIDYPAFSERETSEVSA
jgi:N-ethylmaleimide reductase